MNSETTRPPNHQARIRVAIQQASVRAYKLKNLFLVKTSDKEDGLCFANVFSRANNCVLRRILSIKEDDLGAVGPDLSPPQAATA
jgi:hypothetical protein